MPSKYALDKAREITVMEGLIDHDSIERNIAEAIDLERERAEDALYFIEHNCTRATSLEESDGYIREALLKWNNT